MKKRCTKIVAVLTAALLLLGSAAGCGTKAVDNKGADTKAAGTEAAATGTETTKMEATLKFAFPGDPPKAQDEVNKALEEKLAKDGLNFKLEFTFIPWDQYWNKLAMIAAGGEEYDITWTHVSYLSNLVAKKALAPLDDALKTYGKNLTTNMPSYIFKEATIDGKIYAIPRTAPMAEGDRFMQIRGDLRKKYGVPEVKTLADLEMYFDAIAKNEPDMVVTYNDGFVSLLREFGDVYFPLGINNTLVYVDPTDKDLKVKSYYESNIYKNVINKAREYYNKGWLPKDGPGTIPDPEGALNAGKLSSTWSVVLKTTERIDAFKKTMPDGELENVYLNPEKPKYLFNAADNMLSVFSTSKHVNEAVAFIDWFRSSQENFDLFSYGIKDVNYKLDGESVSVEGIPAEHSYVPINWAWTDIRFTRYSKLLSPEYIDSLRNWDKDAVQSPLLGLVVNTEPIKTELAQIGAVQGEYLTNAINGKLDYDQFIGEFSKKLKEAGLEKVIQEVQNQVDAFKTK